MRGLWLIACLMLLAAGPAAADDKPRYNLVSLQSQAAEEVGNDVMHVTLQASGEARDAADLATQVNEDMAWALDLIRPHQDIEAGTGNYRTWQVRQDNRMKGWRAQQDLMLESRDSLALSRLAGLLQERLQVVSMSFTVADETRVATENRLIEQALQSFSSRARLIGERLQASGYRLVSLEVGTLSQPPPIAYRARMAATAAESAAPVATEGGTSEVRVTVSGTIELTMP